MPQETILIIDDEFAIRESLSLFFEDEGYAVLTAADGEQGLQIFFQEKVDVIITDLRMPVKDGLEVMKTVQLTHPEIPMVVVSGAGKRQDIIQALQMGAKDYITKPITDMEMIRHVIQKVLENKALVEENIRYRKQLEKSETRYRTITEQIAEGVFTVDLQQNITFSNPAFAKMLGYPLSDITQMNLKELAAPESMSLILEEEQSRRQGNTGRYEVQLLKKDHALIHVEFSCSPLVDESNTYNGAISVARDITRIIALRKQYKDFLKKEETHKNVLTVCANCKNVRDENKKWQLMEEFFNDVVFSHGICPECCQRLYPDIDMDETEL